nr:DUF6653 family protein [Pseudovibrio flavus]
MDVRNWGKNQSALTFYSRLLALPYFVAALWTHTLWDMQSALGLCALGIAWLWLTPRLYKGSGSANSWYVRAHFGQRIWLNRMSVPVPPEVHFRALAMAFAGVVGFGVAIWGATDANIVLAASGVAVAYAGRLGFLDQMAKLYAQMQNAHPVYKNWQRTPDNDNALGITKQVAKS